MFRKGLNIFHFNFRSNLLIVVGLILTFNVWAQQKAPVKFLVDNDNGYFEIFLDKSKLLKLYKDTLTVGKHTAEIWSYGYDVKEIEFTVLPDTLNEVYVKLDRSAPYLAYAESYKTYRMHFHKMVTLPVSATLSCGIVSGIFLLNGYDLKKQIDLDMIGYFVSSDVDEIEAYKIAVDENNKKYSICRAGYYAFGGLMLVGIGTSIYTGIKFRNNYEEPVYSKQSPFSTRTGLNFSPSGIGFTYRIG